MESRPMIDSVMPSARYSCDGSPERFLRGKTAKDLILGWDKFLGRPRARKTLTPSNASADTPPNHSDQGLRLRCPAAGLASIELAATSADSSSSSNRGLRVRSKSSSSEGNA